MHGVIPNARVFTSGRRDLQQSLCLAIFRDMGIVSRFGLPYELCEPVGKELLPHSKVDVFPTSRKARDVGHPARETTEQENLSPCGQLLQTCLHF
jgi:hypothetical protein